VVVQVGDALQQILGNGGSGFQVSVVERRFLQYQEPGFDQVELGSVGGGPDEPDIGWLWIPEIESSFV
jgi:hypothetical protein